MEKVSFFRVENNFTLWMNMSCSSSQVECVSLAFAFVLKKLWKKTVYSGIELIWEFPKQCVPWWDIKRCLQFRQNSNLQLSLYYYFFTFRSWYILANSSQARRKRRETLKSWDASMSKYIQPWCFCYVGEKLLFSNICETWSEVMWSSCKRSSGI